MTTLPRLAGVLNFRELGGLPATGGTVRHGAVYRSGHLATATDEDLGALASLGIATVVDFRLAVDRTGDGGPDRPVSGAAMLELGVADPGGRGAEIRETLMSGDPDLITQRYGNGQAHEMATAGAVSQAMDPAKHAAYASFLEVVLDADRRPVLFHCSAGKDRAGWAATLLGMALGVPDDALVEHYLDSNRHRPPEDRRRHYADMGIDVSELMPFLSVHEDYLRAALAAVDSSWSSRADYLTTALDFGPDKVERLREDLLE